jgi:hypothetical protein
VVRAHLLDILFHLQVKEKIWFFQVFYILLSHYHSFDSVLRSHAQGGRSEGLDLSLYTVPLSQVCALNFLELTSVVWGIQI